MSMKEMLKTKICINSVEPNFPLREFVECTELYDKQQVLQLLDEIQIELDMQQSRRYVPESRQALQAYWCFYCAQARAYFRSIIRDPHNQARWSVLLW